jgi:hypothetical protein
MRAMRWLPVILGLAILGACVDQQPTGPGTTDALVIPPAQLAEVFDGSVADGNPHFYFLRPTVAVSPSPTGTFDPGSCSAS